MIFKKPEDKTNSIDYPLTIEGIEVLNNSNYVSPRVGQSRGINIPKDFDIKEKAEEIKKVRDYVSKGETPFWFLEKYWPYEFEFTKEMPQPLINSGLSFEKPDGLADVVHMDMPTDMPFAVFQWLMDSGANIKVKGAKYKHFLQTVPEVLTYVSKGISLSLEKAFRVKYYYGLARPEEVLSENITHYKEGCPNHPSFPAGHGASAAGGVKRIINAFELDEKQTQQILKTAYLWAQFRSFAGVHYAEDNIAGMIVGSLGKYFKKEILSMYE